MYQSMLMANVTPLGSLDELSRWDNRPFLFNWPEERQNHSKGNATKTIRKKQKRIRTAFTTEQLKALEKCYSDRKFIDVEKRKILAKELKLSEKNIKIWFQNRRMKEKKDSSECSSDSLSETFTTSSSALDTDDADKEFVPVLEDYQSVLPKMHSPYPASNLEIAQSFAKEETKIEHTLSSTGDVSIMYVPFASQYNYNFDNVGQCTNRMDYYPNSFQHPSSHVNCDNGMYQNNNIQNHFVDDHNTYPTQYYPSNYESCNYSQTNYLDNYVNGSYALSGYYHNY